MKIQESQAGAVLQAVEQTRGAFADRTMTAVPVATRQLPLATLLRGSISLDRLQELALQRLQQGEHQPLAERRIRAI